METMITRQPELDVRSVDRAADRLNQSTLCRRTHQAFAPGTAARADALARPVLLLRDADFGGCSHLAAALARRAPFYLSYDRARDRHRSFGATDRACAPGGPSLVGTAEASAPGDWHPYGVSFHSPGMELVPVATCATVIHGVAIWGWHLPFLFDAAVTSTTMHRLQHLSFFATALLFWWAVVWKSEYGAAAWHLFITMIHTGILGALMALSPRVLYAAQTRRIRLGADTAGRPAAGGHDHVGAGRDDLCGGGPDDDSPLGRPAPAREEPKMPDVLGNPSLRSVLFAGAGILAGLAAFVGAEALHDNQTKATTAMALTSGDAARAPAIFRRYGCSGCHTIPGIPGADGVVGAPLRILPSASISPACWRTIPTISSHGSFRRSRFRRKARCPIPGYRRRRQETSPPTFTHIDHGCGVGKGGIDLI
jgi:hypothetical protein